MLEKFVEAFKRPLQEAILSEAPKAYVTRRERARQWSDEELVPKRSARLAAKSKSRLTKPEAQARKVMMKKAGIDVHTELPDEASFDEFQEAFKLPLPTVTREALDTLIHGQKQRAVPR